MAQKAWQNWSGNIQCVPEKMRFPKDEEQLLNIIRKCARKNQKVRVVGAGHSWTPLCETDQVLIALDRYQGIDSIDTKKMQATVYAGTKLKELGEALFEYGLAMENLGDIDEQTIAGAVSTGTHGTGLQFGIIPTQVIGFTLITADGELLECSNELHPDIFKAAQVSLGVLGVISKITLQCVPAYKLKFFSHRESLESCLLNLERYNQENRNFEFYWFPYSDLVQSKFSNITDEPAEDNNFFNYLSDVVLENGVFGLASEVTRWVPSTSAPISKFVSQAVATVTKVNWSHRVYAMPRLVKFNEMEYNIPIEQFEDVFLEIKECMEQQKFKVHFPTENRVVKRDDIYLSPAYGRDSAHISIHVYKGKPYKKYFKAMEAIFRNHNGRPHWAKMHYLTANELADLYPMWNKFLQIRQELDPNGMFLNGYLQQLFGVKGSKK